MITIIVMTAARNTKPPNTPRAMMPPMFSRADALLLARERLSPISLSCVRITFRFGRDVILYFEVGFLVVVVVVVVVVVGYVRRVYK